MLKRIRESVAQRLEALGYQLDEKQFRCYYRKARRIAKGDNEYWLAVDVFELLTLNEGICVSDGFTTYYKPAKPPQEARRSA
jgi:acetate kinase